MKRLMRIDYHTFGYVNAAAQQANRLIKLEDTIRGNQEATKVLNYLCSCSPTVKQSLTQARYYKEINLEVL